MELQVNCVCSAKECPYEILAPAAGEKRGRLQTVPDASGKKEVCMKLSLRSKLMVLALALFPAMSAFAANDTHKGALTLASPAQVAGKQLAAGEYTLKWNGDGPTTQVNIIRDGKVVATVPARVVKIDRKPDRDTAEVKTAENGNRTVTGIFFEGKTYALQIGAEAGSGDTSGSSVK